jgi:hypothetical protein
MEATINAEESHKSPLTKKDLPTPKFRGNLEEVIKIQVAPTYPNCVQISEFDVICLLSSTMLTLLVRGLESIFA